MKTVLIALVLLSLSVGRVGAVQLPSATVGDGLGDADPLGKQPPLVHETQTSNSIISKPRASSLSETTCFGRMSSLRRAPTTFRTTIPIPMPWRRAGIRILWTLDYGNPVSMAPIPILAWRQAFTNYAAAAASHFAGNGNIYELYNEPNGSFWPTGSSNVSQYMALANQAIPAMARPTLIARSLVLRLATSIPPSRATASTMATPTRARRACSTSWTRSGAIRIDRRTPKP